MAEEDMRIAIIASMLNGGNADQGAIIQLVKDQIEKDKKATDDVIIGRCNAELPKLPQNQPYVNPEMRTVLIGSILIDELGHKNLDQNLIFNTVRSIIEKDIRATDEVIIQKAKAELQNPRPVANNNPVVTNPQPLTNNNANILPTPVKLGNNNNKSEPPLPDVSNLISSTSPMYPIIQKIKQQCPFATFEQINQKIHKYGILNIKVIINELNVEEAKRLNMQTCSVCFEENFPGFNLDKGAFCSVNHFTCWKCVQENIVQAEKPGAFNYITEEGLLKCPSCKIGLDLFELANRQCPRDMHDKLTKLKEHHDFHKGEDLCRKEEKATFEKMLKDQQDKFAKMSEEERQVEVVRLHIENELLNAKCPRCQTVFNEFTNCFALKCNNCKSPLGWT
jgi:hypothetical protein